MAKNHNTYEPTGLLFIDIYNKITEFNNKWNEFEQNRIKHGESGKAGKGDRHLFIVLF